MTMFICPALDVKCSFWENLVHKIIIACLKWNLEPRLTRVCRIRWWCSSFLSLTLLGKLGTKNQNRLCKIKVGTQANSYMLNSILAFIWPALNVKYPFFWVYLVQKTKIVCLRWNLVSRIIRICWIRWWC